MTLMVGTFGRVWEGEGIAVLGGKIGKFGDCSLLFLF